MAKSLCLFFVLISVFYSIELVNAEIFAHNPVKLGHQRIVHNVKREKLQKRQQSCFAILNDYPTDCNFTQLLGPDLDNKITNDPSSLNEADFTALNNVYSQYCVPKCINPLLNYTRCLNISNDLKNYITNLYRRGICGKNGNDFCDVLYLRRYHSTNVNFIYQLENVCPSTDSGIDCSSANTTCIQDVSNLNRNIGCCTSPYLGDVSSCNVNVVDQCESALSGSITVAPAIMCLILAALLAIFYM